MKIELIRRQNMRVYNLPADALVVFSAATNMPRPYKIKYQTEYGKTVTVKIDTILYTEKQKYCGKNVLLFHCQSEIKGNMYRFDLRYYYDETRWELFKL